MTEVISIQFRGRGKSYYFDPGGLSVRAGDRLVVETAKGLELGTCVHGNHPVEDTAVVQPLRPAVRLATADDLRVEEINQAREREAFGICQEKILRHGLEMKLVDVECSFEGNKILFFFTADGRVDFRELVKDLAGVFRTRIELRQIGVRDEAKLLGGLGICGRPFCCSQFLDEFHPVSTKMAKTQSMSLNPAKISGTCGRLMCCLRYEQEAYEDLVRHVPKNGAFVQTVDGYGNVVMVNLLRQTVKVRLDGAGEPVFHTYPVDEIAEVPGGRPPEGTPLPQVLQIQPKPRETEPEPVWVMPRLFAEPIEEQAAPAEGGESRRNESRRRRGRGKARGEKAEAAGERQEKGDRPAGGRGERAGRSRPAPGGASQGTARPGGRKSSGKGPKPAGAGGQARGEKPPRAAGEEAAGKKPSHHGRRSGKPRPKGNEGEKRPGE